MPEENTSPQKSTENPAVSRRGFFGLGAVTAGSGLVLGGAMGAALGGSLATSAAAENAAAKVRSDTVGQSYPFYGEHQQGIQTPPQDHLVFMSFDITTTRVSEVQLLLAKWSAAMTQLCEGQPVGTVQPERANAIPSDTGEATGLGSYGLTLTLGFGPRFFDERFGLAKYRPALLAELPSMPGESLDPKLSGGDLCIQACANDPQVAYHAVRNLARMGKTQAKTRWSVLGFGRASAGKDQSTPRNLMGFKDGTRNITSDADLAEHVWVSETDQSWMQGGSYMVTRKIHMLIETWDADFIADQQTIFGRNKNEGAPLTGDKEQDLPDFTATDSDGKSVIAKDSHIALAASENNNGTKILRRSYNFTDGIDSVGKLDAGLFFISFQKDPQQFISLQSKLGSMDRLNEYIRHVGSGVFACPRGLPQAGSYYGKDFFE